MSVQAVASTDLAALLADDTSRHTERVAAERNEHLSMHTQARLPSTRLAISTAVDNPPAGCEDPLWGSLPALGGFTRGTDD